MSWHRFVPYSIVLTVGHESFSFQRREIFRRLMNNKIMFIFPPLGFFVLVYDYLFVNSDLILFLSIVAVYYVFLVSILLNITKKYLKRF